MMQINLIMTRGGGKTRWIENDIYIYIYIYIYMQNDMCMYWGKGIARGTNYSNACFFFIRVVARGKGN
ncbi:hypothetical protein DPX39_010039900 [Trypanosoma brucei equiperdum]|uniref:Uncharacterized protein n=1 Tax=Trypanosoma brucei equiperdum TaxID=630700 RepID=A0A3L6LCP0_9TRYP|nr:hypothetical protein DPX39_010039900 [Trypanosoma brucei equiperdum]